MAVTNPSVGSELIELLADVEATPPPPTLTPGGRKRPFLLPAVFIIGLILGWLVIGWWLWPVQWINTEPQHLDAEYQKVYIGLVASEYTLTGDVSRVQQALDKWDEEEMADVLAGMIVNAESAEERERLIALAKALALPDTEITLTEMLSGQTMILASAGLAVLFLGGAVALMLVPAVQKQMKKRARAMDPQTAVLDDVREELGEEYSEEDIFIEQPGTAPGSRPADEDTEPSELEKMVASAENEVEAEEAELEEDEEDEDEDEATIEAPLDDEDDPYLILDEDEDDEVVGGGDPIFDLFEEDDDSSQEIDMLADQLSPVDMDDLLALSQDVIGGFRNGARKPASARA